MPSGVRAFVLGSALRASINAWRSNGACVRGSVPTTEIDRLSAGLCSIVRSAVSPGLGIAEFHIDQTSVCDEPVA